jgi:hypothetical protein
VPFWPLGSLQMEFSQTRNIPWKASIGGKNSLYPEFVDKIQQFRAEEAAQKAGEAKKTEEAKAPIKKR